MTLYAMLGISWHGYTNRPSWKLIPSLACLAKWNLKTRRPHHLSLLRLPCVVKPLITRRRRRQKRVLEAMVSTNHALNQRHHSTWKIPSFLLTGSLSTEALIDKVFAGVIKPIEVNNADSCMFCLLACDPTLQTRMRQLLGADLRIPLLFKIHDMIMFYQGTFEGMALVAPCLAQTIKS